MKRFLKHTILFVLIFFVLEKAVWFLLDAAPHKQYDTRLEKLINGKMNKELIVLGSSKGAGNILATQLEEQTGLSTYNLSYQGSNVNFHEFILTTLLKYNKKPEIILLAIDNPTEFTGDTSLRYRVDVLQPLTNYNYINTTLINKGVNNELSHVFYLSRLNKSHFRFKNTTAPSMNPLDSSGTMSLIKKKDLKLIYGKTIASYDIALEEASKLASFKKIQYLCKKNNIQLIHVFSPSYRYFNLSFFNRFKKLQKEEEQVIVFDSLKPEYRNADYFYDYSHLLKNGAEIFTSEISAFINRNKDNTK